MKKIFCTLMLLALTIPNFCGANAIQPNKMDGEYHVIYPHIDPSIEDPQIDIYAKINMEIDDAIQAFWNSLKMNSFLHSTLNYEIMCEDDNILSMVLTATILADNGLYEKDADGNDIPFMYKQTLNFDMRTGDLIYAEDLKNFSNKYTFTPKDITQKLKVYAKLHNIELLADFEEFNVVPQRFYIDENLHLHFIFANYEVAQNLKYYDFIDLDVTL